MLPLIPVFDEQFRFPCHFTLIKYVFIVFNLDCDHLLIQLYMELS